MFFLGITLTGWVAIIMALSLSILSGIMFMLGNRKLHYLWGAFTAAGAVWGIGFYMVATTTNYEVAQFWWRFALIGVVGAPFTFFHFSTEFIELQFSRLTKLLLFGGLYTVCAVFTYIALTTNLLVNKLTFMFGEVYYDTPPAALHPFFSLVYISIILISFLLIFRAIYLGTLPADKRRQVWYLIIGSGIGLVGGSMDLMLIYGIWYVHPIRNLLVIIGTAIVGFSILKYKLFDVKVVTAQFLTFFIVAFSIIRLVISTSTQEILFNALMLCVTVTAGIYLVRSVTREVEAREQIQSLVQTLEVANNKLKELDRMKSEFLSIASHDLRSPVTAIRNFISLILDGTYGKIPVGAEEGLKQVFERSNNMMKSIEEYLSVSRIEQGQMKYDFAVDDFTKVVRDTITFYQPIASAKGLTLTLNIKRGAEKLMVNLDIPKIQEVLNNLVDNSIKYTPKGGINFEVERIQEGGRNVARMSMKDTGIGMSKETISKLFKLFSTGDESRTVNPYSTGVGLYITRAHTLAHKGMITATSEGEGKGSTFTLDLPLI